MGREGYSVVFGLRDGSNVKGGLPSGTRSTSVASAVDEAEVVLLAVPFGAVPEAVRAAGDLSGRVVIDATNPVARSPEGHLMVDESHGHRSGGERLQALAPGARVVKAFNTVGFDIMADPHIAGGRAVMQVAGDDAEARQVALSLAADLGFEPLDVGPLLRARELEHMAILWISLAFGGMGRNFAFGLLKR